MQAAEFVQTVQNRQGVVISAPEEIAFYEKWITKEELIQSARMYGKSPYGEHLMRVAVIIPGLSEPPVRTLRAIYSGNSEPPYLALLHIFPLYCKYTPLV